MYPQSAMLGLTLLGYAALRHWLGYLAHDVVWKIAEVALEPHDLPLQRLNIALTC